MTVMIVLELTAEFAQRALEIMMRLQAIQTDTLTFALDTDAAAEKCLREMPPSEARDTLIGSLNALKAALVAASAVSIDMTD